MPIEVVVPRALAAKKPPHGAPCNRCGLCCIASLCPLAQHVFRKELGPCPALSYDADGSRCGLVDDPMRHARLTTMRNGVEATRTAAKHLIGSATGCDARINGEPKNEAFYAELLRWDERNERRTKAAKKIWGIA